MNLELSLEEIRVLEQLTDRVMKNKDLGNQIYAGDQGDIEIHSGIAGKVRALYQLEKVSRRK